MTRLAGNMLNGIVCPTKSPGNSEVYVKHQNLNWRKITCITTYMAKPGEVERKWYVVDATDVPLGRLFNSCCIWYYVVKINQLSHPHLDTGDFVIVIEMQTK